MVGNYRPGKNMQKPNGMTGKRSELLEQTVKGELKAQHLIRVTLADRIYEKMRYNKASGASQFISQVGSGYVYGTSGTPLDPALQLYRLSVVLEGLGLPEEHRLIKELRRVKNFEYPPVQVNDLSLLLESR